MPVVERPFIFGVELPFLDKEINPDLSGRTILRVKIHGLEGEWFTDRRLYIERLLVVRSENWVNHFPAGGPKRSRGTLQREEINIANIELRAKRFKIFGVKIRWKE